MNVDFFRVNSVEINLKVIESEAPDKETFSILKIIVKDDDGKHEISIFANWGKDHYHVRKTSDNVIDRLIEFVIPGLSISPEEDLEKLTEEV